MANPGCRSCLAGIPIALGLAIFLFPSFARAAVPKNQIAPNVNGTVAIPAGTAFASVVAEEVRQGAGLRVVGSGAIVGKMIQDNVELVCVLTAAHVDVPSFNGIKVVTSIGFGNNPTAAANSFGPILRSGVGGPTGNEDIALQTVKVGTAVNGKPDPFFDSIKVFKINDNGPAATFSTRFPNGQDFTQAGYGLTGNFNSVAGRPVQFYDDTLGLDGNKRFQSNTARQVIPGLNRGTFTFDAVQWQPLAPGTGWGRAGGAVFQGDSGSPLLVSSTQVGLTKDFNYVPDATGAGNPVAGNMISIDTDSIMGVTSFITQIVPHTQAVLPVTDSEYGVYLSANDKIWIMNNCPEPSSLMLLAPGMLILVCLLSTRAWPQRRPT
jgi:hypothetical protein